MEMVMGKTSMFRVNIDTGTAFKATAELLGVENNDLLESVMKTYIKSIRMKVADVAVKHPVFADKYPFVQ